MSKLIVEGYYMSKLSKKDEKTIQRFKKLAQQNTESENYISNSLQPLINDIRRMEQFDLNFSYIILGDPFFDFELIENILRSNSQSITVVKLDLNTNLLTKNNIQEYFSKLAKQIGEDKVIVGDIPKPSGYQGSQLFTINKYEPEPPMTRFQQGMGSEIKQLANLFDEIIRLLFSSTFKNFGIVLMLPEKLEEQFYKTFHEWEQFKKIKILSENRYREEVCIKIIEDFSERERTPYLKNLENTEIIYFMDLSFDNIGFNPRKFLNNLKEKSKQARPKPVTKKDIQFVKEILPVLISSDKTRHVKLRNILMKLKQTNFDVRNILVEMISSQMQDIEKAFDLELKEKCEKEYLNLIGDYPNYSIEIQEFGIKMIVEVRAPFGNVYVDGEALENKFPSGVVEKIKNKIETLKKLEPKFLTDDELINLFIGNLKMYKSIDDKIIDINEFIIGVLVFLNSKGIYPISADRQHKDIEYLKKEFAKAPVVEALKKYVTFETGKTTADRGIRLSGLGDKLYTIMKLQRDENNGYM